MAGDLKLSATAEIRQRRLALVVAIVMVIVVLGLVWAVSLGTAQPT